MTGLEIWHVERPCLPWRREERTECGLPSAAHPTLTRVEFESKVRKEGLQRSQVTTCQTCWSTARRHPTWEESPSGRLARECVGWAMRHRQDASINDELRAIALLIDAHREEFDATLAALGETIELEAARRARKKRTVRGRS